MNAHAIAVSSLLLGLGPWTVSTAHAQSEDTTPAEEHLRRGYELRAQGETEAALVELEQAYRMSREPKTAAALGLTEAKLERWRDAERHLTEALEQGGDPWVQDHRTHLERARAVVREHLDDAPAEPAPEPEPTEGEHEDPAAAPAPAAPPRPADVEGSSRTWTWVALGFGAAAGVTALALRLKANGEFDRLKTECGVTRGCTGSDLDRGRRLDRAAQATFGLALVGVAAAGVLFFFEPRVGSDDAVEVGLGPTSALVRGRF